MFLVVMAFLVGAALAQPQNGEFGPPPFGPPPDGQFPPPFGPPPFEQQNGGSNGQFGPPPRNGQWGPPPQNGQRGPPPQNGQWGQFNAQFGGRGQGQFGGSQNGQFGGQGRGQGQFGGGGFGGGPEGGRGPPCRSTDADSASMPECMNQFFKNGVLLDGNGRSCNRKGMTRAKLDRETLLRRAEEILQSGQCQREQMGPPPMGGGFRPTRGKRQMNFGFGQTCSGVGVGNCETKDQRLESIYIEKDLGDRLLIIANGIPDHCYHDGAVAPNPNLACEHYRMMVIPKNPRKVSNMIPSPMGPIGIAKSGAFFYNHKSAEASCSVAAISEKASFDACDGHADPFCRYHYHKAPNCMPGFDTCGLIGYNGDGFPIYGKCTADGVPMKSCYRKISGKNGCDPSHYTFDPTTPGCNLDQANGYTFTKSALTNGGTKFQAGTYAYFFTPDYPFIMPGTYGDKSQTQWCVISP